MKAFSIRNTDRLAVPGLKFLLLVFLAALLTACGGKSDKKDELSGKPLSLRYGSAALPHQEVLVAGDVKLYIITNVEVGKSYTVSLTDMIDDADLYVYPDKSLTDGTELCFQALLGPSDESCTATPASTSMYVYVPDYSWSGNTIKLNVVISGVVDTLAYGTPELPASLFILPAYTEKYEITGLTAGALYQVSLTGVTNDIDLYVFSDLAATTQLCGSYNYDFANESCLATSTASVLYVVVDDFSNLGSTYSLNVTLGEPPPQLAFGTADLPFTGGSVPANGSVLYEITSLIGGNSIQVLLSGLTQDADLEIYSDMGTKAVNQECVSYTLGTVNELCEFFPAGTSIFVKVIDASGIGTTFTLDSY